MSRNKQVLGVLLEFGPMTAHDVAEELGISQREVSLSINSMRRKGNQYKLLHIHSYVRTWEGIQPRPRAVWAAGDGVDAKPPRRISQTEACRRWRAKKQIKVASVFEWMRARV